MVRAKFKCISIARSLGSKPDPANPGKWIPNEVRTVKLVPVYGGGDPNHENSKFWNATPTGSIEIGCANLEASAAFELDQEYYVDFSLAPGA